MENYTITFSPFIANNTAQITTTAMVALFDGEVLWDEPVVIAVRADMVITDVEQAVKQAVSGFDARVNAILLARSFQGTTPNIK